MISLQVTADLLEKAFATEYVAAAITCLFNAVLLVFVKRSIDTTLETHKIAYSGIFKEKIEVHRQLLTYIYSLRLKIQRFHYFGNEEMGTEIRQDFENFINYYLINQPFLTTKTIDLLKKLNAEYQDSFEAFYINSSTLGNSGLSPENITKNSLKAIEAMNKFKADYFQKIESEIISDMREDLNTK